MNKKLVKEDATAASTVPANATGVGVVGTGDDTKNMTWAKQKKKLRDIVRRKSM